MNVSSARFGSYLTYAPWGKETRHYESKSVKRDLKEDRVIQTGQVFSEWIVNEIEYALPYVHFFDFFDQNTWLVPIPRSSQQKKNALWVPRKITTAMQSRGLGQSVECLVRKFQVTASHTGLAKNRLNTCQHYESMAVRATMLPSPQSVVLVDDIITRGATSLGAVNRIHEAFPDADIRVFAIMRTITNASEFSGVVDPCVGCITLRSDCTTLRRP